MNEIALIKCLCMLGLMILSSSASAIDFYLVNSDKVNIRKGPGQQWDVIANVGVGQLVLETRRQGYWSEVFYLNNRKAKIQGWVYNTYLIPQALSSQPEPNSSFKIDVAANEPVCIDRAGVSLGSTCYLDVDFHLVSYLKDVREVQVSCWADFVVPGHKAVTPVKATHTQKYHLLNGEIQGQVRLNAGLNQHVAPNDYRATYYNCSATQAEL